MTNDKWKMENLDLFPIFCMSWFSRLRSLACGFALDARPASYRIELPPRRPAGFIESTMQQYIDRFSDYLKHQRNASAHTLRNYLSDLEQFHDYLCPKDTSGERRDIDVRQIDHITIRDYMAKLYQDKRKKSSIARKLATLRTFFKFLCREQVLELNPARLVSSPRLEKRLPKVISVDEVIQFIETPDTDTVLGTRDRAIIELLYATCCRVSAIAGMNLDDIDFRHQTIRVRGKGRKERFVPFGSKAMEALRPYFEALGA